MSDSQDAGQAPDQSNQHGEPGGPPPAEPAAGDPPAVSPTTPPPAPPTAPSRGPHLRPSSVGKLFGAYLLDAVLFALLLGFGWLLWGAITAGEGQTPAKKLLGMRAVDRETGRAISWGRMVFLRGLVGGLVMGAAMAVVVGVVLLFMPLWDRLNQSVWGKVSNSVVVDLR